MSTGTPCKAWHQSIFSKSKATHRMWCYIRYSRQLAICKNFGYYIHAFPLWFCWPDRIWQTIVTVSNQRSSCYYSIPKGLLLYIANDADAANDIPSIMGDKIPFKDKPQDHDGCLESLYVLNPGQLYQQCRWWFNWLRPLLGFAVELSSTS